MSFTLKRAMATVFVLWGVCTITFFLLHLTPGDPVEFLVLQNASGQEGDIIRHQLGLDRPLWSQYISFFNKLGHGDLGLSYTSKKTVSDELLTHMPSTFMLALASMVLAMIVGIPLGVLWAVQKKKWLSAIIETYSLLGLSMPSFWLGPLLIIFFSIKLDWFPVSEQEGFSSIVLPAVSLGLGLSAVLARMTRASVLEVLSEDYVRVARAKGLSETKVLFKHALKNALTPIVTMLSLQFGAVLTGVVITETIFDWPGLGILLYSGLRSRNYPVVQGCVLCIATLYVMVNFTTDLVYFVINPKLRSAGPL